VGVLYFSFRVVTALVLRHEDFSFHLARPDVVLTLPG